MWCKITTHKKKSILVRDFEALKNLSFCIRHRRGWTLSRFTCSRCREYQNAKYPGAGHSNFPVGLNILADSLHAGSGLQKALRFFQRVHFFLPGKNAGACSTPDISNFASYPHPHIKFNLMWGYPLSEKNHFSAFYCLELSALFTHLHCRSLFLIDQFFLDRSNSFLIDQIFRSNFYQMAY